MHHWDSMKEGILLPRTTHGSVSAFRYSDLEQGPDCNVIEDVE